MKRFFGKKNIFAFIFFIGIFIFSGFNLLVSEADFEEIKSQLAKVSSLEQFAGWRTQTEEELGEEIAGSRFFTEVYGGLQRVLMKNEYNNFSYIKGEDGMLYYGSIAPSEEEYLTYALRVKKAMEAAEKKGAKTLFVLPPSKVLYGISQVDKSLPINDKNAAQDEMLLALSQCGVPTLDLRDMCRESGLSTESLFYKTDHSWTTETAFLAAAEIVEEIAILYGDNWDKEKFYTDINNYEASTYLEATTGSFGREAGILYSGRDDYTVLIPRFKTRFLWYNVEKEEQKAGSFQEALVTAKAEEGENPYGNPGNHIYLEGIVNRDRIENPDNPHGPRILCLRDSYFSPVACFLAPMCSQIDMVWARRKQNQINYEELILEGDYDYLIIENYPYNLDEEAFDYFRQD